MVPTEYYSRFGGVTETHQYSVSEYLTPLPADGSHAPALDLLYDLSPIVVTFNERPPSVLHYVVRMSAVVGGVFAMARESGGRLRGGGGRCTRGCCGAGKDEAWGQGSRRGVCTSFGLRCAVGRARARAGWLDRNVHWVLNLAGKAA